MLHAIGVTNRRHDLQIEKARPVAEHFDRSDLRNAVVFGVHFKPASGGPRSPELHREFSSSRHRRADVNLPHIQLVIRVDGRAAGD